MGRRLATCTVMLVTDGRRTVYAVMRGWLYGSGTSAWFDAGKAETVATKAFTEGHRPDYAALTSAYTTPGATAVPWQDAGQEGR